MRYLKDGKILRTVLSLCLPSPSRSGAECTWCLKLPLGTHERFGLHLSFAPDTKPSAHSSDWKLLAATEISMWTTQEGIPDHLRPPLHFLGLDLPCNWFSHFYFNFEPVSSLLKQFSFSLYFSHMCLFLCENIYQWSWTCVLCTSGNILEFYLKFFFINMGY